MFTSYTLLMPVSGDARSRGCSTGVLASGGMAKPCGRLSLAVTDTASRLRMHHTTPSSLTVLRFLRVGFPIPFVSQTHSRSIAPFLAPISSWSTVGVHRARLAIPCRAGATEVVPLQSRTPTGRPPQVRAAGCAPPEFPGAAGTPFWKTQCLPVGNH